MFGRLATGLVALFGFGRRADRLTGSAKVIDGDTIVVAGQLVRLKTGSTRPSWTMHSGGGQNRS
jgi:hypothetical protein